MPEPTSTSSVGLAALFVALLGPAVGEYATIVFAALAGALWPLSTSSTPSRRAGAALVLRLVLTSATLTGVVAWYIDTELDIGISAHHLLAPVSFVIAAIGDGWKTILVTIRKQINLRIGATK